MLHMHKKENRFRQSSLWHDRWIHGQRHIDLLGVQNLSSSEVHWTVNKLIIDAQ